MISASVWRRASASLNIGLACAIISPVSAADRIGSAEQIVNLVTEKLGKRKPLAVGRPVHRGENIRSARDSNGEFVFKDRSRLAVGPNASVYFDKFVYSGGGANEIVLNAVRGAFRFASGKAGSPSYKIKTPTSAVGIRGTLFDGFIGASGESFIVLLQGAVEVCNHGGGGVKLNNPCECVRIEPSGRMSSARQPNADIMQGADPNATVPYIVSQDALNKGLRAPAPVVRKCGGGLGKSPSTAPSNNMVAVETGWMQLTEMAARALMVAEALREVAANKICRLLSIKTWSTEIIFGGNLALECGRRLNDCARKLFTFLQERMK